MSGGTPTGGGYMRQRHSQGYASSGDDLEDDACSRTRPTSPSVPRNRTWIEVLENFLWLASAVFIIYYGDWRSNLRYLLLHDDRIRSEVLIMGSLLKAQFKNTFIPWDVGCWFECSHLCLFKYVNLECQEV